MDEEAQEPDNYHEWDIENDESGTCPECGATEDEECDEDCSERLEGED